MSRTSDKGFDKVNATAQNEYSELRNICDIQPIIGLFGMLL